MSKREYREIRVPMTSEIENTLVDLIVREKDFEKKKKHASKWYRDEVSKSLKLTDDNNPSLRSYEDKVSEIKDNLKNKNPLDTPWCLGCDINIDREFETISKMQRLLAEYKDHLTNRAVKWLLKLAPFVMPYLKEQCPNNNETDNLFQLFLIVSVYKRREQISEILKTNLDTSDLDHPIIIDRKITIDYYLKEYQQSFIPDILDRVNKLLDRDKLDKKAFEDIVDTAKIENIDSFIQWTKLILKEHDMTAFLKDNPENSKRVNKWVVVLTRENLAQLFKYIQTEVK